MTGLPPPPPAGLLAGWRLPVSLGHATVLPDLDFETYSEAGHEWDEEAERWRPLPGASVRGLPAIGAEPYVRHPTFRIVWLAYDLKDGRGKRQWRPGLPPPADLLDHVRRGGLLEAWNAGFERWVWELYCVPYLGWPPVHERQWRCAMAKARAFALPGKLELAAPLVGSPIEKDPRGKALMDRLSSPVHPKAADPRRVIQPVYGPAEISRTISQALSWLSALEPDAGPRKRAGWERRAVAVAIEDYNDTLAYGEYNATDIAAEAEVSKRVPDLPPEEYEWWLAHERVNRRGIHVDRAGVENCIAVIEQAFAKYNVELAGLTGIDSASKVQQLQKWLRGRGVFLESLDEEAVEDALKGGPGMPPLAPDVKRVLEIRAAVGSASVKKLYAMRNRLSADDRLRDLLIYHAARTGRSTGEGPQPLNLPKAGPDMVRCGQYRKREMVPDTGCGSYYGQHRAGCPFCHRPRLPKGEARVDEWNPEIAEQALRVIATRDLQTVEGVFGEALPTIAGCLRALFDAAPGHDLISTDYNSIEAVGLAELSGEAWRKRVFRDHGKIYEASASTMFGVALEEILGWKDKHGQHHPLRQKGKIGELAFGYQGWVGSALAFDMPGTEDEIKQDILRWRAASPAVEWLWGGQDTGKAAQPVRNALREGYEGTVAEWHRPLASGNRWNSQTYYFGVEGMAVLAMLERGVWHAVYRLDGTDSGIAFRCDDGQTLYCRLPSGRLLTYHRVRLSQSDRGGYALSYEGWNTNPKNGPKGWIRMNTWGGRLVENINQATCRDILAPAVIALEARGYPVVLHVYDEIVAEVPEGVGSVDEFEAIVTVRPTWASDWPIKAPGGYRAKRYRKG